MGFGTSKVSSDGFPSKALPALCGRETFHPAGSNASRTAESTVSHTMKLQ